MKIGLFIQARSNSSRLPNKIFEMIGEESILGRIVQTCKQANILPKINEKVIAVLCPKGDEKVILWCKNRDVLCFAGSEENLINRYLEALKEFQCGAVIRITGDCPFIPVELIDKCVEELCKVDYVSNTIIRSYPEGYDLQGASLKAWEWLKDHQTEEVEHPWKEFDANEMIRSLEFESVGLKYSHLLNPKNEIFVKTSVDIKEDLDKVRKFYESTRSR